MLAGFRPDVLSLHKAFDVFVMSSVTEGLGTSLLDAMACGKPVVATSVGGIPEVVVDGETGFLVPPRDPEALAAAIVRLLADRGLREQDGRRRPRARRSGLQRRAHGAEHARRVPAASALESRQPAASRKAIRRRLQDQLRQTAEDCSSVELRSHLGLNSQLHATLEVDQRSPEPPAIPGRHPDLSRGQSSNVIAAPLSENVMPRAIRVVGGSLSRGTRSIWPAGACVCAS